MYYYYYYYYYYDYYYYDCPQHSQRTHRKFIQLGFG